MKYLILLFLLPSLCHAEYKLNPYTNQKDFYESTAAVAKSTGALTDRVYALEQSGVGGSTIAVNSSQFIGNGATSNPLTIKTSSITAQGNTFNAPGKLLLLDESGLAPSANIPSDSSKVSKSGDAMTGPLVVTSSMTANTYYGDGSSLTGVHDNLGNHIATKTITAGYGIEASTITTTQSIVTSSDVVAHAYYGDGSHLTGVSTSGGAISTAAYDGAPIGTFINYGSTIPPAGYLYCDGTNYSTTTYRDLFNVIGYNYSGFAISSGPVFTCDFRGMFSRGLDTEKLRDSEHRVIGSTETDTMQRITGGFNAIPRVSGYIAPTGAFSSSTGGNVAWSAAGVYRYDDMFFDSALQTRTSVETRPRNIAVAVMVKYGNPLVVNLSTIAIANTTNTFTGANTFTGSVTVSSLTATGAASFTSATSTTTFSGWVDIGYTIVSVGPSNTNPTYAYCPTGYKVLGGGGNCQASAATLYVSQPAAGGSTGWSTVCQTASNNYVYAICARIK